MAQEPRRFVVLQETTPEFESWYHFLLFNGNEQELKHLNTQLESVKWTVDDNHTFDLELDVPVSEQTAKEMIALDLNRGSFHRKFNGKLQSIDFGLKPTDSNRKRIKKVNKLLQNGGIEDYIGDEEIDPEIAKRESASSSDSEEGSDSSDEKSNESEEEPKKKGKHPKNMKELIKREQAKREKETHIPEKQRRKH